MAKKPSERRNYKQEDMELNLTPMMNLIAILIPCLLISVAFVEIAVVGVSAPAIGASSAQQQAAADHPPINLTVTITDSGYVVSAATGLFENGAMSVTIPTVQRPVSCQRYLGTVPPPRSANKGPRCEKAAEVRNATLYDTAALASRLVSIKDQFPDERRVIIAAERTLDFEPIIDVMDASRDVQDADGAARILFDEVVFSPVQS